MRLIVADDSLLFREGLVRVLADAGFEIVGQTGDTESILQLVSDREPDVVIVDIRMPPTQTIEGLVAAERIRALHPTVGVVLLSHHVETHHATRLLAAGAGGIGYLLKDRVVDLEQFVEAVRRVAAGGTAIDPQVVSLLLGRRRADNALNELTHREREVLRLMAEGLSNASICTSIGVSSKTLEAHVRTIYQKLHLEPDKSENRRVMAVLSYLQA